MVLKFPGTDETEQPAQIEQMEDGSAAGTEIPATSRSGSTPTSRIALQKIHNAVAGFSGTKKFLVEEIGFGGALKIPLIPKISLKFSRWIMERVDLQDHSIVLGGCHAPINFYHQDFHKVFGIPCGDRDIHSSDADTTPEAVEFMRNSIGWNDKSDHSMKTIESFIAKDIVETSSRLEKDCFKMAYVVFVMGNLFAPCSKYDYTIIDYWGAIKDTDCIEKFNWCKYAFDALMESVSKLQADVASNAPISILYGCHLFLQVFLLDNVDMGILNLKQNRLPRIELFDAEQLRRMILMCVTKQNGKSVFTIPMVRHGTFVCYTRHNFLSEDFRQDSYIAKVPAIGKQQEDKWRTPTAQAMKPAASVHIACSSTPETHVRTITSVATPNQYTNYMHTYHPSTAASPLGWALKEHNAKCVQLANKLKEDIIAENLRFTKKVIQEYELCQYRSAGTEASSHHCHPLHEAKIAHEFAEPLVGRKLDLGASPSFRGTGSALSGIKSKAGQSSSSNNILTKKSRMDNAPDAPSFDLGVDDVDEVNTPTITKVPSTAMSATKEFAANLVCQLLMISDEVGDSDGQVTFGQTNTLANAQPHRREVELVLSACLATALAPADGKMLSCRPEPAPRKRSASMEIPRTGGVEGRGRAPGSAQHQAHLSDELPDRSLHSPVRGRDVQEPSRAGLYTTRRRCPLVEARGG